MGLLIITTLFFTLMRKSIFDARNVMNGKYIGTKIFTNDSTYTSTATNYFIGKTDKYVFIRNEPDNSCLIIQSESIKKIILIEK
jgi:hypothetical protein